MAGMMPENEEWRPIVGYEGLYEVSNRGGIRSLDRVVPHSSSGFLTLKGQKMKPMVNDKNGYPYVTLTSNAKQTRYTIHRLVAKAFLPNPENHPVVRHLDDVPSHNYVSNLAWGTFTDNGIDARENGRNQNTNKTHCHRGHPLESPNLVTSVLPYRSCRACSRERAKARNEGRGFDELASNLHYERIIAT